MIETMGLDDFFDVRRGTVNSDEPIVVNVSVEIVDEVGIGVDRDQHRVRPQAFQDRTGERADPGAIFDEQPGPRPVDRPQHAVDQDPARRNYRSNHDWMLQEAPQELPPRTLAAAAGTQLVATLALQVADTAGVQGGLQ